MITILLILISCSLFALSVFIFETKISRHKDISKMSDLELYYYNRLEKERKLKLFKLKQMFIL